jgi:ribose transport system permease protein
MDRRGRLPGWLAGALGLFFGFPRPAWIALAAFIDGSVVLELHAFGRHVLAIGGGEERPA